MRTSTLLLLAALVGMLAPLPLGLGTAHADGQALRSNILQINQIRPGMKGYGLTVFQGTKPERFGVEVIDVLKNFRARQDLILIKTFHPRLEVAKVVGGMSGSPIYIDNKMIGAYAYGWSFGVEPVAGVTPIRNMLDELGRPLPERIDGWPLRLLPKAKQQEAKGVDDAAASRYGGDLGSYDLRKHARQMAIQRGDPRGIGAVPVTTPLLMGGMTTQTIELARELLSPLGLEPLQAGGGGTSEPNAPTRFEDGGAIAVQLVRGDFNANGFGTVTRVEGDKLVAFGHPMMEAGVTALPTAIGRVLWLLASDMRSFKLGMPVREVGTLVNDRQAAIVVSHSITAPVIPVHMSIRGVPGFPSTTWNFEVAHERFVTPTFVALSLGSALQAMANEHQDVSWNARSELKIRGFGSIVLEDYGVAIGGTPEAGDFARSNLVRAVGAILNNPWQPALIEGASMAVELRYAREVLRLRGAEVLDPEVFAGQPARVRLRFSPYSGREVTRVVSVPIPAHLAGQTVMLDIVPGYLEDREVAAPESLPELIQNLQNPVYPAQSVVVSYNAGDASISFRGRVARHLPPGALDVLRPMSSSVAPDAFSTTLRHVIDLGQFMVGKDRVSVNVKPVLR